LHQSRGKTLFPRTVLQPARKKGLARAVLAPHRLEPAAAGGGGRQLLVDGLFKTPEPDSKELQTPTGHRPDAESIDDFTAFEGAGFGGHRTKSELYLELLFESGLVERNGLVLALQADDFVTIKVEDLLQCTDETMHPEGRHVHVRSKGARGNSSRPREQEVHGGDHRLLLFGAFGAGAQHLAAIERWQQLLWLGRRAGARPTGGRGCTFWRRGRFGHWGKEGCLAFRDLGLGLAPGGRLIAHDGHLLLFGEGASP